VAFGPPPNARRVNTQIQGMASANSTAWATSRVMGLFQIQYSGASAARIGDQWLPSKE
jgi:hypothetical protein